MQHLQEYSEKYAALAVQLSDCERDIAKASTSLERDCLMIERRFLLEEIRRSQSKAKKDAA